MSTYAIEAYVVDPLVRDLGSRAQAAAESMGADGFDIRYMRTLVLPADETCFHVVEASSVVDAAELARRARFPYLRVTEAAEWQSGCGKPLTGKERR